MGDQVLVAGVSSRLGRAVAVGLAARGHRVRGLSRARPVDLPEEIEHVAADCLRAELEPACAGVDRVFSCVGASVQPSLGLGRASFHDVDLPANTNLLRAAQQAGVRHMTYVSVAGHPEAQLLRYVSAHEQVVQSLRDSGLKYSVVRPTGFFSAFEGMLPMAKFGVVPLMGDGLAKSNPISDADLAEVCCDGVEEQFRERDVGGPEVLSRQRIAQLAFEAWGKQPRTPRMPALLTRVFGHLLRPLNPRVGDLLLFYAHVMTHDCVVPAAGSRTLAAHFAERVGVLRGET